MLTNKTGKVVKMLRGRKEQDRIPLMAIGLRIARMVAPLQDSINNVKFNLLWAIIRLIKMLLVSCKQLDRLKTTKLVVVWISYQFITVLKIILCSNSKLILRRLNRVLLLRKLEGRETFRKLSTRQQTLKQLEVRIISVL